jgi:small subunit ribosomal protein S4
MARDTSPQCKQCRREGQKLFLKGERCLTDKCGVERRAYPPGDHGRGRQKQSEYRVQLREKQKARRYYGVLEKQFRIYYDKASRQPGITGENLLSMLESRLDNVLVRLGFAGSRRPGPPARPPRSLDRSTAAASTSRATRSRAATSSPSRRQPGRAGRPRRHRAHRPGAGVAAGRSRLAHGQGAPQAERREIAAPVQEQLIVELYSK